MNRRKAKRRLYGYICGDAMHQWPRRYHGQRFTVISRLSQYFAIKEMRAEIFAYYGNI